MDIIFGYGTSGRIPNFTSSVEDREPRSSPSHENNPISPELTQDQYRQIINYNWYSDRLSRCTDITSLDITKYNIPEYLYNNISSTVPSSAPLSDFPLVPLASGTMSDSSITVDRRRNESTGIIDSSVDTSQTDPAQTIMNDTFYDWEPTPVHRQKTHPVNITFKLDDCPICLDPITEENQILLIPCGHYGHNNEECMSNQCPLCRTPIDKVFKI